MSRVKDWGMHLMQDLTSLHSRGLSTDECVQQLTNELWDTGRFQDKDWLKQQIQAVMIHPEMYGHTPGYWRRLNFRRFIDANRS